MLCLLLASCGERSEDTPRDAGPRIVSLSPAASILLRDAGLEDAVVGRHGWDAVLDPSLPVAGDQTGLDYERIIALEPTHVVIEWGARDLPDRLVSLADDRGFAIVPIDTLTLADIARSAERVQRAFGARSDAVDLAAFSARLPARDGWGAVLLVVATSPSVDCLGPGSAHHELLELGGFTPAIAGGAPWITLSLEDVIGLDPDCIVLVQPGGSPDADRGDLRDRLGPLAATEISAVRHGRVVLIDEPTALIPSTNLVGVARRMWDGLAALGPLPSPP